MEDGFVKVARGQATKNRRGRKRRSCDVTGKVIKGASVGGSRGMRGEESGTKEGVFTVVLLVDIIDGNAMPPLCFDI